LKNSKKLYSITLLLVFLAGTPLQGFSQDSKKSSDSAKAAQIGALVNEQRYFFIAESTTLSRGGLRQITGGYHLRVSKDTLVSDLPYFGRSYTGSYGTSDGGIKFTSVDFGYKAEPRKKGGWNITLNPKEMNTCREMNLLIYEDGSASLNVSSNDKQPISFKGIITAKIK
jgi:hypothetical protein